MNDARERDTFEKVSLSLSLPLLSKSFTEEGIGIFKELRILRFFFCFSFVCFEFFSIA